MAETDEITLWLQDLAQGDATAADKIWNSYFEKLVTYARRRLQRDAVAGRAFDEEDVALSAMNSFCKGMTAGKFANLEGRDDLWKLLLTITARKINAHRRKEMRLKRGGGKVRGESVFADAQDDQSRRGGIGDVLGAEPTPDLAVEMADVTDQLLDAIDDERAREIVVLRLQGYSNVDIAEQLDCTRRTVERKLANVRSMWELS